MIRKHRPCFDFFVCLFFKYFKKSILVPMETWEHRSRHLGENKQILKFCLNLGLHQKGRFEDT